MTPLALALALTAAAEPGLRAEPPALEAELQRVVEVHGGTVLAMAVDRQTRRALADLAERPGGPDIAVRASSPHYDPQATAKRALADLGLRCAAVVDLTGPALLTLVGDCRPEAAVELSPHVERLSSGGRGERVESDVTLAITPAMVSGLLTELSWELRTDRTKSVGFAATRARTTAPGAAGLELPAAEATALVMQFRRYWAGDFDTGIYGLAQLGGVHAEGELAALTQGLARPGTSPTAGVGAGAKLTLPGGLTADVHLGLSTQTIAPVAPLGAARLGWSF